MYVYYTLCPRYKMKLPDIKKLKVAELRSRLTELGLDSRGLKAELVDRLWSASQTGRDSENAEEKTKHLNQSPLTPSVPEQTEDPPSESRVTARCEVDPVRQYINISTQTEPEPGLPAAGEAVLGHTESLPLENISRGRAFYEFKEEIKYKRYVIYS